MAEGSSDWVYPIGPEHESVGVLRGLSRAGDPLCMLGMLLASANSQAPRRWIIDNRAVETGLHPDDLRRFCDQIESCAHALRDIAVAWVGSMSSVHAFHAVSDSLPIQLEIFEDIAQARHWLRSLADLPGADPLSA